MKKICLLIIFAAAAGLITGFSEPLEGFDIKDKSLLALLSAQQKNNQAYAANEAFLETGNLQYDISKSVLYPQITADISGSGSNSFLSRTSTASGDFELRNNYTVAATPSLSLTQLLPTAGILSGSVTETFSGSGLEESNSPASPSYDIEYNNILSFSLGISQPLYFGKAYDASLTQLNQSREITKTTYLDNRNSLIASAFSDYYQLFQTSVQKSLVKFRLETNLEYEKRMLREHQLGMWTKAQLNSAKAARLQSEADLLKAEYSLKSAEDMIFVLYGIKPDINPETADIEELPLIYNLNSLETELIAANPETIINEKQLLISKADIIIAEKDSAITFTAGSTYAITNGITNEEDYSDNLSFSLGFSIPAVDGGSAAKTIELKKNEAERIRNSTEDQQKRTLSQLKILFNNIAVSRKLSEIYKLQEETAVFDFEKNLKELELGQITQKDLLDQQITLENTRLSILTNKIEYNLTILQIYRLIGLDLQLLTGLSAGANS